MKKKLLLVLPLITLVAGCGVKKTNIYELPKGGRYVNIEDEEDLTNFRDLINDALIKSADALLSKAKVNLMIEHLSAHFIMQSVEKGCRDRAGVLDLWNEYVNKGPSYNSQDKMTLDFDDLCLDLGVNAWGLGGNVEDISAQVDLSASGGISFEMIDFYQNTKDEAEQYATQAFSANKAAQATEKATGGVFLCIHGANGLSDCWRRRCWCCRSPLPATNGAAAATR